MSGLGFDASDFASIVKVPTQNGTKSIEKLNYVVAHVAMANSSPWHVSAVRPSKGEEGFFAILGRRRRRRSPMRSVVWVFVSVLFLAAFLSSTRVTSGKRKTRSSQVNLPREVQGRAFCRSGRFRAKKNSFEFQNFRATRLRSGC